MPTSAILAQDLCKRFGKRTAVESVSFSVQPGELFGFLGPNGAGKTTTIKLLCGLLTPTSGIAALDGHDLTIDPLGAKAILGYVPDNPYLYEKLSGVEMLQFVADIYRVPRKEQQLRIESLLERYDLTEVGSDLVQSYSRGMRQKLSLACALVHRPKILFLDEPTVGLDPAGVEELKATLREFCANDGTVFLSTHVLSVAELLCDRVGVIAKGRLIAVDSPSQFRRDSGGDTLEEAFLRATRHDAREKSAQAKP